MVISGIDHQAVAVNEVDGMADWYCQTLDYKKKDGESGKVWLLEAADGSFLEVMKEDGTLRQERGSHAPGYAHLAFRVKNLDKAIEELQMRGLPWKGEIVQAVGGGRVRNFTDPEGNLMQIVER